MTKEKIFDLEKFLKECVSVRNNDAELSKDNIFHILGVEEREIRHSNFLAWIFSNEHFGTDFTSFFLKKCAGLKDCNNLVNKNFYNFSVERESNFMDIKLEFESLTEERRSLVVIVEVKINTNEHSSQLKRYYDQVQKDKRYAGFDKKYIFLTLDGHKPEKDEDKVNWTSLGFAKVVEIVKTILKQNKKLDGAEKIYLEKWREIMAKLTKDYQKIQKYHELYMKYDSAELKEALRYLPNFEERTKVFIDFFKQQGDIFYANGKKANTADKEKYISSTDFVYQDLAEICKKEIGMENLVVLGVKNYVENGNFYCYMLWWLNDGYASKNKEKAKKFVAAFREHFAIKTSKKEDGAKSQGKNSLGTVYFLERKLDEQPLCTEREKREIIRGKLESIFSKENRERANMQFEYSENVTSFDAVVNFIKDNLCLLK